MKTTKRIFAFTMAVMICVSYCMTHINASGTESYEFLGNCTSAEFIDGFDSYAKVHCSIPGWNEEVYTDFYAQTYAINVTHSTEPSYYVRASVEVSLYYDDEHLYVSRSVTEKYSHNANSRIADAYLDGNTLIDMDHGIEYFTSRHDIEFCTDENGVLVPFEQYGPTIYITTSY